MDGRGSVAAVRVGQGSKGPALNRLVAVRTGLIGLASEPWVLVFVPVPVLRGALASFAMTRRRLAPMSVASTSATVTLLPSWDRCRRRPVMMTGSPRSTLSAPCSAGLDGESLTGSTVCFSGRTYPLLARIVRAFMRCRRSLLLAGGCCCCCHRCCQPSVSGLGRSCSSAITAARWDSPPCFCRSKRARTGAPVSQLL